MSVLIVDDNQSNIDLLRTLLEDEGINRIEVEIDSRLVADRLASIDPDLVLLDLHMPHISGHDVLQHIVQFASGSYLPVIVLTADVSPDARDRALAHGARDFLTKPLDLGEVVLRIANLLETRQLYVAMRPVAQKTSLQSDPLSTFGRIDAILQSSTITPFYQKIVAVDTGVTVGHEALARFPDPHARGPAGWFSDAFDVGLGVQLEWLAATQALPLLETTSPEMFLALNMSPATIQHLDREELCASTLCPQIVVELTEHVPIEDYSALHRSLHDMRECGARLAADDLGSGYAGFRHLIALEPDIIKLDISLVKGIHRSRGARALTRAIVAFAADMGAIVIAEGVEESLDLMELQELNVPWAQGYLLGRPEPRELALVT